MQCDAISVSGLKCDSRANERGDREVVSEELLGVAASWCGCYGEDRVLCSLPAQDSSELAVRGSRGYGPTVTILPTEGTPSGLSRKSM